MSDVSSGLTLEAVTRKLRAERSLARKRAIIKALPPDWFIDNADGIVVSPEKVLRQQLVPASAARPERLTHILDVVRQRVAAPAPNAATAEAVSDSIISILTASRLGKALKPHLSLAERIQLIVGATGIAAAHSLTPHPKLKTVFKDPVVGPTAFADRGANADVRRLILKLAPKREPYLPLFASGIRRGDDEMLRLLSAPGLPLEREEAQGVYASAAHAIVTASHMRLEARAQSFAALVGNALSVFEAPTLVRLSSTIYEAAASTADRFRVARHLVPVLEAASVPAGEDGGIQAVLRALVRFRGMNFEEYVGAAAAASSEGETVAWFFRAVTTAKDAQEMSTDEVRALARTVLRTTATYPEAFALISAALPKGPRVAAWWGAALDELESLLARKTPSDDVARAVGAGILASEDATLRERLFDTFLKAAPELRVFWAAVLRESGIAPAWHSLVSGHVAETEAEATERESHESRAAFDRGYARASTIFQEKLKALTRAAAQLMEVVDDHEAPPVLRTVLNDILTVLASVAITATGELGEATHFDPAIHEDSSGGLSLGDEAIVTGIGFVLETPGADKEYLRKIRVRARPTGG